MGIQTEMGGLTLTQFPYKTQQVPLVLIVGNSFPCTLTSENKRKKNCPRKSFPFFYSLKHNQQKEKKSAQG